MALKNLLLLLFILSINSLKAQAPSTPIDSILVLNIDPLVVTENPLQVSLPASFLQIPTSYLKREDVLTLQPVLNRVPGIYMQSGALNTNRISIRGIGSRSPFSTTRIRVYLDDIPITSGDGTTTLEDIDISLLHRIKVWKGPTASIYGAGLGGMIHLQTPQDSFSESQINTSTTIGSFGLLRQTVAFGATNEKGNWIRGGYNLTDRAGYRENSNFTRQGGTLMGRVKLKKQVFTIFSNITFLNAQIPSSLDSLDFINSPQSAASSWLSVRGFESYEHLMLGVSHHAPIKEWDQYKLESKTSLFFRNRNAWESRPFNILDEENRVGGVRAQLSLLNKDRRNDPFPFFSAGFEYFTERYDWRTYQTLEGLPGDLITNNTENRSYYNIFLQNYWSITPVLTAFTGVNINSTRYQYEDLYFSDTIDLSGQYSFDPVWSPRIGLTYQFGYNYSIFTSLSHGFAAPTLAETLTPDGFVNPSIQPEKGWNLEIGSRGKLGNTFTYEIALYRMIVRDLLVAQRIGPDQFVGVNAGLTQHNGLEAYLEANLLSYPNKLLIYSSYTLSDYRFLDFVEEEQDYSGNRLPGTTPHQIAAGIDFQIRFGWYARFNYLFVGASPILDDNSLYSDPYGVADLKVGYNLNIGEQLELEIFGGIRNAFNKKYASMLLINAGSFGGSLPRYYYPGLPRHYYAGLNLNWRF